MKSSMKNVDEAHHEWLKLLPWYANKSLGGQELQDLEKHLSTCFICKRELVQIQRLAQLICQDKSFESAEQASFTRLKNRLHQGSAAPDIKPIISESRQTVPATQVINLKNRQTSGKASRWFNQPLWAVAATFLLGVMFVPLHTSEYTSQLTNSYRTLSSSQPEKLNRNEIRVVFGKHVNDQTKNLIVQSVHGALINTPTEQGVYTIRLDKNISSENLINTVDVLRKDANIIFAEPAYAFLSSIN